LVFISQGPLTLTVARITKEGQFLCHLSESTPAIKGIIVHAICSMIEPSGSEYVMPLSNACNLPLPPGHISQQSTPEKLGCIISDRTALVAVIGLGYVGLPLAMANASAGFQTIGLDVDPEKVSLLNDGQSEMQDGTAGLLADTAHI
jgi:phosphoglycerate dehydrogenase-like enzyme